MLEVANGAVGERHGRFRSFAKFRSQGLSVGDVFEASLSQTLKALETIRVNGRSRRDTLDEEKKHCLSFEVWDPAHSDAPRGLATLLKSGESAEVILDH